MNISSFFNTFGGSGSSSGLFGSINLSDYAAIRNGSYRKLMKSYYSQQKENTTKKPNSTSKVDKKASSIDKTGLTQMKKDAETLKTSAEKLKDSKLWEKTGGSYDETKITNAVKDFVTQYNDVISQTGKVASTAVSQSSRWLTSLTDTMSSSLNKIGISVGTDNKLSLDEEKFKSADMNQVKALFQGSYSYGDQVAQKASGISSAVVRNTGLYSSDGTVSTVMASLFESWT